MGKDALMALGKLPPPQISLFHAIIQATTNDVAKQKAAECQRERQGEGK